MSTPQLTDPQVREQILRLGKRYAPKRFAIVEAIPASECVHCGSGFPSELDVLVTGYQMHDGKAVLLDESHEEIGRYPSPAAALRSYALEEDHEPGKLEVIWIDETPNGTPTATASGAM